MIHSARLAIVIMLIAGQAVAADLSPAKWPPKLRAAVERREAATFPASTRTVQGSVLVTGTLSPLAVHAGIEALRQGGTAADAAATVELTQVATDFGAVVSYAGVSQLLYFEARTRKVYGLDAGWGSYRGETDPASIPVADVTLSPGRPAPTDGAQGRKTLVPGFMAGVEALHARFGRLPFSDLFQPAIWYAENGVAVSPLLATYFQLQQQRLWRTPEGHRFASLPDGQLPKAGDRLAQPDLAKTLRHVAAEGAGYMYRGGWAQAYVAAIRAEGGAAKLDDLARYKAEWRNPVSLRFYGAEVYGPGEDSDHTCPSLEALNLLSGLKIESMGPYWTDAHAFAAYSRVLRFATLGRFLPQIAAAERAIGPGDDCKVRLTPAYAAAIAPQIPSLLGASAAGGESGHHSDSVVVVDRWGNVAVLVHSINAVVWGDTGIVVGGVPIPDSASINKARLVATKPGERLGGDMTPLLALRGGRPVLAVATIGSSLHQENVRLVAGLLAQGLDLRALLSAPPLLLDTQPPAAGQTLVGMPTPVPAGRYDATMLQALEAAGVAVREEPLPTVRALRGTAVVAVIDGGAHSARTIEVPDVVGFAEAIP
ncbi:MAG TPA: gamma-glutamyltransferase [Caulobacteraceae bacterium]|jgi:gamma-glutamyltranspeptidase/glutathione hydrolase